MSSVSSEVIGSWAALTLVVTAVGVTLGVLFPDRAGWLGRFLLFLCVAEGFLVMAWSAPHGESRLLLLRTLMVAFGAMTVALRPLANAIADRVTAALLRRVRVRSPLPGELIRAARTESFFDKLPGRILRRQAPSNRKTGPSPTKPEQ